MTEEEVKEHSNDREFILKAVAENGKFLDLVSKELQNDKEVVMTALEQDAESLEFASNNLKNDKEREDYVIKAVIFYDKHQKKMKERKKCPNLRMQSARGGPSRAKCAN